MRRQRRRSAVDAASSNAPLHACPQARRTDLKEGPILAQSWFVLDRIRATVEAAGGQMNDVFKLVQYFKNLDHFPHYSRVRKLFFTGEPPASTVVEGACAGPCSW